MSTCRITRSAVRRPSVAGRGPGSLAPSTSPAETQSPEPLGKGDTGLPAGVLGGQAHGGRRPLRAVGELAPVATDGFPLRSTVVEMSTQTSGSRVPDRSTVETWWGGPVPGK